MKKVFALVVTMTLVSFQNVSQAKAVSFADLKKEIKMGEPTFKGNGCPEGTAGAALTPDKNTLSVAFDEYFVETGTSVGVKKATKKCTVMIPMKLPKGLQFAVMKIDQRGYNFLPKKASTRYVAAYTLLDAKAKKQIGPRLGRTVDYKGPLDADYMFATKVTNITWSPCGQNVNFKFESSISTATNSAGDDTLATIDTFDISAGNLGYQIFWRKCK